jgi:hypothetical protein
VVFVVDKLGLGYRFFSEFFSFPLALSFHQSSMLHARVSFIYYQLHINLKTPTAFLNSTLEQHQPSLYQEANPVLVAFFYMFILQIELYNTRLAQRVVRTSGDHKAVKYCKAHCHVIMIFSLAVSYVEFI